MLVKAGQRLSAPLSHDEDELLTSAPIQAWPTDSVHTRSKRGLYFGIAFAATALVAAVLFRSPLDGDSTEQTTSVQPSTPTAGDDAKAPVLRGPIAHVITMSDDCKWMFDRESRPRESKKDGLAVSPGAVVRVIDGEMTLEFVNGVQLKLVGPALFGAESSMRGRVLSGKCRTTVSPGAEGFTLETPNASVIDVGTEFGLEVDQLGHSDVVVYEGAVVVDSDGINDRSERRMSLLQGEAVRIQGGGLLTRLTSIDSRKFARRISEKENGSRRPLILKVDDNLQRVWNYYEIVHGGMREDVKAFLDRENQHEWNGLTELGMPAYLVGGDYVKMFKGDQIIDSIEIRVTLSEPTDLYILFDERVPTPAWLESDYVRTGDRIGLDMGPWEGKTGDQYENAMGPGNSIDRVAVVWRRRGPVEGTITLGATESGVLGTEMYGIVAQPAAI